MKVVNIQAEEKSPEAWTPRVITGGKGPPQPPTNDWLKDLSAGTTFVARANENYVDYELYHVVFKTLDAVLLKWELPDGKYWDRFVNSKEFSRRYRDYIILGVQQQEEENGNGNRADRLGDVVLHEAVPGEHQLPEGSEEPGV